VKGIELGEDVLAFRHYAIGGLSVGVNTNKLYGSAFKEKREDFVGCIAVW
jgi:hypothetical protein